MTLRCLFGKNLKSIREKRGLTQQEFAELVNMQPNSIGQIEIGYKAVSFNTLEKFAQKLNMEYREFFDFENEIQTETSVTNSILHEVKNMDIETQKYILHTIKSFVKYTKR